MKNTKYGRQKRGKITISESPIEQMMSKYCTWIEQRAEEFKTLIIGGTREDALVETFLQFCHSQGSQYIHAFPKVSIKSTLVGDKSIEGKSNKHKQFDVVIFGSLVFDEKSKRLQIDHSRIDYLIEVKHAGLKDKITNFRDYGPIVKKVLDGGPRTLLPEISSHFEEINHYEGELKDKNHLHAIVFASTYHENKEKLGDEVFTGRRKDKKVLKDIREKDKKLSERQHRPFEWINEMMESRLDKYPQFNWKPVNIDNQPFRVVMNAEFLNGNDSRASVEIKLPNDGHKPVSFFPVLAIGLWEFTRKVPKI